MWKWAAVFGLAAGVLCAQPTKEYIYLGGRLIAVDTPGSTIAVSPATLSVAAAGGSQTITVTGSGGWAASSSVAWVTVTAGATGTGNGSVTISVAANGGAARTGSVSVSGQTVSITQAGGGVAVSPSMLEYAYAGGSQTFTVTAASGVAWSVTNGNAWLQVSPASGTGTGAAQTVTVTAAAASADRTGTLSVGGNVITVSQWGAVVRPLGVTPSAGSGAKTVFTFTMAGGASARSLFVLFNQAVDGNQACFIAMDRISNWIGLAHSTDSNWASGSFGGAGYVENSNCRVNTQTATVTANGPNWDFRIEIEFTPWVRGAQNIFAIAGDVNGAQPAGWLTLGTYTPFAQPPMPVATVTPTASTGRSPVLRYRVEAQADGRFLRSGWVIIGPAINPPQSCTMAFDTYTGTLQVDPQSGGAAGIFGQAAVVSGINCSVDLSKSSLTPDATGLTLEVAVTFATAFGGTNNNYITVTDRSGRAMPWQTAGTWAPGTTAPTSTGYTATAVGGTSRAIFNFTFSGGGNFGGGLFLINRALDGNSGCFISFGRTTETLYLLQDNSAGWTPATMGQNTVVENSLCRIRAATSSVTAVGNNWEARVDLELMAPMAGPQKVYMLAQDTTGANSPQGWLQGANYVAYPTPAIPVLSATPSAGTGTSATFTYRINTQIDGRFAMGGWALLNTSITTTNACYFSFDVVSRVITIDPASGGQSGVAGSAATLNGAMCSVSLATAQVQWDSTGVTMKVPVTFGAGFSGLKNHYLTVDDRAGRSSGWQQVGQWGQAAGVLTMEPQEYFGVGTNSARTMTAKCDGIAVASGVQWAVLNGAGLASIAATGNPGEVAVTVSGVPSGGYASVQASYSCGGTLKSTIAYLYMTYYQLPAGPNVSPNNGSGLNQNFQFWWSTDIPSGGVMDGTPMEFLYAPNLTSANNACYMLYYQNTIYLRSDTAMTWQPVNPTGYGQPVLPGVANLSRVETTENSQCKFLWAGAYTFNNGFQRNIILPMQFKAAFGGTKSIFGRKNTTDNGTTDGFVEMGSWVVR